VNKLAQAQAHARKIFEVEGFKYLTGKWKPDPGMLREAAHLLENGEPLPYALGWYAAVALRIQAHRGTKARKKETNYWRNLFITDAVNDMRHFGFLPTRGYDKQDEDEACPCGCSIVAKVLVEIGFKNERGKNWKEGAVVEVWKSGSKRKKRLRLAKLLLAPTRKPTNGLFSLPPGYENVEH
jgi:hypothetical protein